MSHIPEGYHTTTPHLVVKDAARALRFYREAFGAEELFRLTEPGGKIAHAEFRIGDSLLMLAEEYPELGYQSPETLGGTPIGIMLYVEDADAVFARAVAAGATPVDAVADQFYGDRTGAVRDPSGHLWRIAASKETFTPEELQRRFNELLSQGEAETTREPRRGEGE